MNTPRNHHFVPQVYLRQFANGMGRKAQIICTDLWEGKSFKTHVRNVGAKRDFNRIDFDGIDPNSLEKGYAEFESEIAPALKKFCENPYIDDPEQLGIILNLASLLAVRNPKQRGNWDGFMEQIYRRTLEITIRNKGVWESTERKLKESGEGSSNLSFEEINEFYDANEFDIIVAREENIKREIQMQETVLQLLVKRNWTIFLADVGAGEFITSDHPISLRATASELRKGPYGLGYGMSGTIVLFPISSNVALGGQFEDSPEFMLADKRKVATINSAAISNAERQIYSRTSNYFYEKEWKICDGKELKNELDLRKKAE